MKPHRCRTWAPRGQTPVLQFHFNWKKLSAADGITFRTFYFRLYEKAMGSEEIIDFLKALTRHIHGPLLIVWDRLPAHKSRLVQQFIAYSEGHIVAEYLPEDEMAYVIVGDKATQFGPVTEFAGGGVIELDVFGRLVESD